MPVLQEDKTEVKKVKQGKLGGSKHSKGEPLGLTHPNRAFFKLRSARLPSKRKDAQGSFCAFFYLTHRGRRDSYVNWRVVSPSPTVSPTDQ